MRRLWHNLSRLVADQAGQTTIEWALLIAAVGLPAVTVFGWLLSILSENYRMVTFMELLPFP
ncbi:MAG TPA: hypothetical protein VM389_04685 [Phycisphaerae bacterium]|nr:hypothetical protein [Phycisphaerae bacterium]HUU21814.1 hypothetical protein [Phycisphaerae bacterium]